MTTPKKGDRVRIVCEGIATTPHDNGNVLIMIGNSYSAFVPASAVEVLPPPVRVGDVATREVLDGLPRGSVVRTGRGGVAKAYSDRGERRWLFTGETGAYDTEHMAGLQALTVLYIPPDPQ